MCHLIFPYYWRGADACSIVPLEQRIIDNLQMFLLEMELQQIYLKSTK